MYGFDFNTWAVSPATDDDYYLASGTVSGAGAVTLLQTTAGLNGIAYKVLFTSAGDSSTRTWTIVGHAMGTPLGKVTTEVVTAPNATTALSTNYYDRITSITASGAMTGAQKIGVSAATVALPYTRIVGVHWVATGSAGTLVANRNGTGVELFRINTPALATESGYVYLGKIPTCGSNAETDYTVITPTNVTYYTLVCG